MKTFLVHYTRLRDRKEFVDFQFSKFGIQAEVITDYDKDDLSTAQIDSFYEKDKTLYESKIRPLWDAQQFKYRELNMPEISCTIKHFEAIRRASEADSPYSLIFEDDIVLVEDFNQRFEENLKNTPDDWDAIFIGTGCGEWFQKIKLDKVNEITKNCFLVGHPATNCAEAYLIKKDAADKVFRGASPFHLISDWELAYQLYNMDAKVYWWYPSLIEQGSKNGMFNSTLDLGQRHTESNYD
jgi:GR25 family glycosyltransferase involved in LPS biosynthesis